jgi:hypothetical protein
MENSHYPLTAEQTASYQEDGFLLIRGFLDPHETSHLQEWTQEVHDLPRIPDAAYMPFEVRPPGPPRSLIKSSTSTNHHQEVNAQGKRVLCRTENYANSHAGFNSLLRGKRVLSVLEQLADEEMLLFKEKINYKLAGSGMNITITAQALTF